MTFTLPVSAGNVLVSAFETAINALIEGAVSASAIGYPLHDDTTAGLAATDDGEGFSTLDSSGLNLYLNDGGVASLQGAVPLSAVTDAIDARVADLEAIGATGAQFADGGVAICATTANITLSGEQTIDGVTTSTDRVLVKDQTDPAENGIYVSAAGAWSRATDMDTAGEVAGTAISVKSGTANGDKAFATYSAVETLGTDDIEWIVVSDASAYSSSLALKADADDPALTGDVDMSGADSVVVPTPSADDEAATKAYVDSAGSSAVADTLTREVLAAEANVFNVATASDNTTIYGTTGAEFTSAGYFATDFIPVVAGKTITLSHDSAAIGSLGYAWYDEDEAYVSGAASVISADTPLTVPTGAIYVRISFKNTTVTSDELMISLGDAVPGTYTPHLGYTPTIALDGALDAVFYGRGIGADLLDRTAFVDGYYCNSNGVLIANVSYTATGLFPVPRGGTITLAGQSSGASNKIQYFDASGAFISADDGEWTDGDTRDVPANAVFARIGIETAYLDDAQVLNGSVTPGNRAQSQIPRLSDTYVWAGTSWLLIGDSISANSSFAQSIVSALHATTSLDATRSARKIEKALYRSDDTTALVSGDFTDVDAVHFWLGTNDWAAGTAIGAITDTPDYASGTTFYALFMGAIEQILTWAPTVQIFVGTAMWRDGAEAVIGGGSGGTLADYNDAIVAIANKYALPIIDYRNETGLNDLTIVDTTTYSGDGVHPNGPGRNRVRGVAVGRINSVHPQS